MAALSFLSREHLQTIRAFFDSPGFTTSTAGLSYRRILANYYNLLIPPNASVLEIGCGDGELLLHLNASHKTGIDLSSVQLARARARLPDAVLLQQAGEELNLPEQYDIIILSDTLNLTADVQLLLEQIQRVAHDRSRLIINFQNNLYQPLLVALGKIGLKSRPPTNNWLSQADVVNLLNQAEWEIVHHAPGITCPLLLWGLGSLINKYIAPLFPSFVLSLFLVARPRRRYERRAFTVSVVVPARNEAGNIEQAILRTPEMGTWTEFIFVEGHSTDHTWSEIQRIKQAYPQKRIKILQQSGRGKGNAVREGFAVAEGELLMILDADLTMPPEELPKFYTGIATNRAEFANGSRLVYPMEKKAMRFLNMCANKAFGLLFTWLLNQQIKDTLCGTKVLLRSDYEKIAANRHYFGEFDPFGDFDLLFGASKLGLQIADIPIRYRDRTYGETNIQRWKHGWLLLRMVLFAARKIKFIG